MAMLWTTKSVFEGRFPLFCVCLALTDRIQYEKKIVMCYKNGLNYKGLVLPMTRNDQKGSVIILINLEVFLQTVEANILLNYK